MTAVTTMTPSTARGRRTRDGLVSAARAVFERRGFSDTRMSDIADAASVSHGTVYTYFPSKEAVLSEVCNAIVGEVFAAVRVPDDQRADPITWIEEGNRRYLRAYSNNARMLEVVEQAAAADPQFRELVDGLRVGVRRQVPRDARSGSRPRAWPTRRSTPTSPGRPWSGWSSPSRAGGTRTGRRTTPRRSSRP